MLQTIIELYNDQKYQQVVALVNLVKESERYQYFDESIIITIQRYYCQSLVKIRSIEFEAEVEFFAEKRKWIEYYFLKGFWCRYIGNYIEAEKFFQKVFEYNSNHLSSKRELLIIYLSTQDYDAALELAKNNYKRRRDNLFHLQAYLECLLEQKQLDETQEKDIQEMLTALKIIHKAHPNPVYYLLMGKYEAYRNKNLKLALEYIDTGLQKYPDHFYLTRAKFDIFHRFNNIKGMEQALIQLSKSMDDFEYKGAIFTRTAILNLHKGKSARATKIYLQENGFSKKAIDNILSSHARHSRSFPKRNKQKFSIKNKKSN